MFQNIDFEKYANTRISFYNELFKFKISDDNVSQPITLDESFFRKVSTHLSDYLNKFDDAITLTRKESNDYRKIIKKEFPEINQIFEHKGPTVYWFKIHYGDGITNELILNQYHTKKDNNSGWWAKHDLRRIKETTDILYLGKIESNIEYRFLQHIGIGNKYTTGLKLRKWLPELSGLSVTFQFLKLNNEMKIYLEDIENVLWRELKPLLGASPRIKEN